ncbi:MAG: glycosyltransferase family 4 protein [Ruminococcaceae bacterium]|nr:glycosyltransferase family 4 protein [Oscillospiraceae bacterium]
MRIAIFTEAYLPRINGVVTHIKLLKEGLEARGHDVLIVTADGDAKEHYLENGVLHCPGIKLTKKLSGFETSVPVSRKRLNFVRDFKPDIIHVETEFGVGLCGVSIAKMLKVPLVYTMHTMYDEYIYYIAPRPLVKTVKKLSHKYMRVFANRANAITGPSEKCSEYLSSAGVKLPVNVIPNPVELDDFSPEHFDPEQKRAIREKFGIPQDAFVVVFVGRLGREKSIDLLIDYWNQSVKADENMYLFIIGGGPEEQVLRDQIAALGCGDRVIMSGRVEHPELPPYLLASDIYVTASLSDTNSISMLEGMAAGLPVLQRRDPINADQIKDGENGWSFDSPEEMAELLRKFRDMPEAEKQQLKESTRQSIMDAGCTALADRTLHIYDLATGHHASK